MPSLQNKTHEVQEQGVQQNSRTENILVVIVMSKKLLLKFDQQHNGKFKHRGKNIGKHECSAENKVQEQ